MLRDLHISGLGVVDDLELSFHPGLNVLTGETGAGKTMITVGLSLALGQRAAATLVRAGAAEARVEARFDVPAVGIDGWGTDGELVLGRRVGADGKGSARADGQMAPVSTLADLAPSLVEVHGQHQGAKLLSPTAQMSFVDRYVGREHLARLAELSVAVRDLRALQRELEERGRSDRDRERERDLLVFQIDEIERAEPREGELEALANDIARLEHAERLIERASEASEALTGEGGAGDLIARAAAALSAAAALDGSVQDLSDRARALAADVAELGRDASGYREGVTVDPGALADAHARVAHLRSLIRKYADGGDERELLARLERARSDLEGIDGAGARLEDLREAIDRGNATVASSAARISADRASACVPLADAIRAELRDLGMPDADVRIDLVPLDAVGTTGAERPEIAFSGGANQPLRPLAKVASGGELSRTMLALRSVLIDLDDTPTLVFDEVDAGIGGRAGVAVGRRLARIAARRQVLVVTHLPQIAAFADRHIRVEKDGGTAKVEVLDDAGRVAELSRMLSGLPGSDAAATHAEELLLEAGRAKAGG